MSTSHDFIVDTDNDKAGTRQSALPPSAAPAAALTAGALLSACGGGGSGPADPGPPVVRSRPTAVEASRFLAQASMGSTREQIAMVQSLGYDGWIDEQFALPVSGTRWDWLVAGGYTVNLTNQAGVDACIWRKLLSSPDTLRQRITLALSEIVVLSISVLADFGWSALSCAAFLDMLEANAFGNYRTLLQRVSLSVPMGEFMTYCGNAKFNPMTGAMPDENFAREVMQLFTIGVRQLNLDGTPKLTAGLPTETYTLDDIIGLARVFTGWDYDLTGSGMSTPDFKVRPMTQTAARHETGAKTFLGTTIAAGTDGMSSLTQALDAIFAHANVAPFISRQLIQRLVCSNPSPAYVARVATVFNNDGAGVKGNLKAVVRAILLDTEARGAAGLADPTFGKLREPILRFSSWARAFRLTSPSDTWPIGDTSDPGVGLGQSPLRASSVFNFFRPGYVPPNSAIAKAGLVAPEFQITNESTVVGYLNYMQAAIRNGSGDAKPDYAALLPLADTAQALLDELNLVLAAGQLSAATMALIKGALESMAAGTDAARLDRICTALFMVMAAPEFIVQK
jgi:uncharacterized protein (DUF1800 family)